MLTPVLPAPMVEPKLGQLKAGRSEDVVMLSGERREGRSALAVLPDGHRNMYQNGIKGYLAVEMTIYRYLQNRVEHYLIQ